MSTQLCSGLQKVTHCIFDLDGLLLDTESIYEEIVKKIVTRFKKLYPRELRLKVLGLGEHKAAVTIITDLKLPITLAEYLEEYHRLSAEMLGNAKLKRGAERLLKHLHASKVPIALATSSGEKSVALKTQNHCLLFDLFSHKVCGSTDPEVKEAKPAPDVFLVAARRFCDHPPPSCCLVFEDAPNGVKAACAAGMQCVMVPEDHTPNEMRYATQVLNSLEDFKPEDFGLPHFPLQKTP